MSIDCQRGCLLTGQHTPDCTCHHECPDHHDHCEGCLPKPADTGGYCNRCTTRLRNTLNDIATLITQITQLPDGRLAPPDRTPDDDPTRRATRVDQHSPSPAHDTADEATRWLNTWALAVADDRNERGPFHYRRDGIPEPNPTTDTRYLTNHLDHITQATYANDLTDEAAQLAHQLTRAAAADEGDQRIPTRCPACNQRTLIRPNGFEHVTCRNRRCGATWSAGAFGILARAAGT